MRFCALGATVLFLSLVTGCRPPAHRSNLEPGQLRGANVLLVTVDTLRRDRLGAYGGSAGLAPTLDGLARQGVRYTDARAHAPMTLPSHTSILTGLTPRHSGVRNNTGFRLDDRVPTLATLLKQAGYRTGAFVGAFVLDARFGLARGFDVYDDRLPVSSAPSFHFAERRAADVVKAAGDWILSAPKPSALSPQPSPEPSALSSQPFFAWVHLFDPHAPYDAPPEFRAGRTAYDAEIAYADAMLGALIARLRDAGQLDRTLIIATADHGESLGDHGETTHGLFAYDATLAVPLIVGGSPIRSAVVDRPVAHVDILPTVLDLLGMAPPPGTDGFSLAREQPSDRAIEFEALDAYLTRGWAPLRGIVRDGFKYIDLPEAELYDLAADRAEIHNVIGRSPRADAMRAALPTIDAAPPSKDAPAPMDADARARLRSLGYAGGSAPPKRTATVEDDPKRLVALNERFNSALTAFDSGAADEAIAQFSAIVRERPDFLTARTSAAVALMSLGRARQAVDLLRSAPQDQQNSPELLAKLGAALRDAGDLRGAASILERAHEAAPGDFDAQQDLAIVYAALRRADAASALFHDLVTRNPAAATAWYNLGLFELQNGRADGAAAALRQAVARQPGYGDAWNALGAALVKRDRTAAIDAWLHAEALLPRDYDLLFNVGTLLADSDNPSRAVPFLRRFAAEAPRERYARDIAQVQQRLAKLER